MRPIRPFALAGLLALAVAAPAAAADDAAGGGLYTSAFTKVTWFIPEGWTPVTHGIPTAGSHAESYPHHAMFSYPEGVAGAMPSTEEQVFVEIGVNPVSQLCLADGDVTPDALVQALIDYNRRIYPEMQWPTVEAVPAITWSNGVEAGAVAMSMGPEFGGTWSAWMLDDDTVGWLFIGGMGDSTARDAVSDVLATSLAYTGDAAHLEELFAPYWLEDPCSPMPA
jgi:hypothetical protein